MITPLVREAVVGLCELPGVGKKTPDDQVQTNEDERNAPIPKKGPFELSTLYSQKIAKPPHVGLKGMRYASAGRRKTP